MVEFLSDYSEEPDGRIFVEFDGAYGKHRHFITREQAESMIESNEKYNDEHPEEVAAYLRAENEFIAECIRSEMQWAEEAAEAEQRAREADQDAMIDYLERKFDKRGWLSQSNVLYYLYTKERE